MKTFTIFSVVFINIFSALNFAPKSKLLIEGYDPVSYFDDAPLKGLEEFSLNYKQTEIWFIDQNNLDKFKNDPEKYFPKYGGWCAYAMGKDGSKVEINPKTFEIRADGLYLFYNKLGTNTLKLWHQEGAENLKKNADINWNSLEDKSPND